MRNSSARSIRIALAIYLTKLRQGISNSVLATIFRLGDKRLVSHILQQVRQHLKSNFVSQHLGFIDITREEVLTHHQTTIANKLLTSQSDQVCVAIDGTYMYIQKSSNNTFQRRTYSMHKHHNLLKPMIITTTDGYILSVLGPYFADYKNNDASIIKYCLMNNEQDMLSWFKDDDIMIVDRGFGDSITSMKTLGFIPAMPEFLNGKKQLSTEEANKTRCVTKTRWVIESATLNIDDGENIAIKMLEQLTKENVLDKRLNELEKQKALKWKKHGGIFCLFPSLTSNDIENITFGSYQIHRAKSYIQEHLKTSYYNPDELTFEVESPEDFDGLVRARFQSAHSNSKSYISTIQFDTNNTNEPIQGWCCTCTVGLRVVGCCSHICALLWHLGVNRGIITNATNPLLVSNFMNLIEDSMAFSDIDNDSDDDNNIKYSLTDNFTGTSDDEQTHSETE
ncbi:unnamed protein product [Rotaria magnacalcarata]|nr:unnamed protein product [Rotaria magnacalcarata]